MFGLGLQIFFYIPNFVGSGVHRFIVKERKKNRGNCLLLFQSEYLCGVIWPIFGVENLCANLHSGKTFL